MLMLRRHLVPRIANKSDKAAAIIRKWRDLRSPAAVGYVARMDKRLAAKKPRVKSV